MVIGYLHDRGPITGGAEMSLQGYLDGAPEWVDELVYCSAHKRPPARIDAFIVHNCTSYGAEWIEELEKKPVIKKMHDVWTYGDPTLRRWILDNARLLIFHSALQRTGFRFPTRVPWVASPQPIDMDRFRRAAQFNREGTMWLGRVELSKGIYLVVDWALREGVQVDMYGPYFLKDPKLIRWMTTEWTRWMGPVDATDVPALMGRYERMVYFPLSRNCTDRVMIEAWASGLALTLMNHDAETFFPWVETQDFDKAAEQHWEYVHDAINT